MSLDAPDVNLKRAAALLLTTGLSGCGETFPELREDFAAQHAGVLDSSAFPWLLPPLNSKGEYSTKPVDVLFSLPDFQDPDLVLEEEAIRVLLLGRFGRAWTINEWDAINPYLKIGIYASTWEVDASGEETGALLVDTLGVTMTMCAISASKGFKKTEDADSDGLRDERFQNDFPNDSSRLRIEFTREDHLDLEAHVWISGMALNMSTTLEPIEAHEAPYVDVREEALCDPVIKQ